MSKEMWCAVFDEMVEEYEIEHDCTWGEAYKAVGDNHWREVDERCADKYADMIDAAKDRAKAEGTWPPKASK